MRSFFLLLVALLLAVPGCGNGNIGDVFAIFPPEAFEPGDGTGGDDGGGGMPVPFMPAEVATLGGAQGVTGDVRNIAIATVGGSTFAFIAAGTNGVHVVDVTVPDLLTASDVVTTIRAATLATPPAALAGGTCHDLTVVDNAFLVCIAVGTGAANAVTVFDIATLIAAATSPAADVSAAFVAPTNAGIAVPGTAAGKAGGVSGANGTFFVATGDATLGVGVVTPGMPSTWAANPAVDPVMPDVVNFLDVLVVQPFSIVASVRTGSTFGLLTLSLSDPPIPAPQLVGLEDTDDNFDAIADDFISGPGNHPLELATDGFTNLFVSGDGDVKVFSVTLQVQNPIPGTGMDTIAVDATQGTLAVGAGDAVRAYRGVAGQFQLFASVSFPGTVTIRGVALQSTTNQGDFVLCCAGTGGLRVVQLTQAQP